MTKKLVCIAMILLATMSANAQLQHYMDSLSICKARIDSLQRSLDSLRSSNVNGQFFRLFAPVTFYPDVVESIMSGNQGKGKTSELDSIINNVLMQNYLKHPELIETTACKLQKMASRAESAPTVPVQRKVEVAREESF